MEVKVPAHHPWWEHDVHTQKGMGTLAQHHSKVSKESFVLMQCNVQTDEPSLVVNRQTRMKLEEGRGDCLEILQRPVQFACLLHLPQTIQTGQPKPGEVWPCAMGVVPVEDEHSALFVFPLHLGP
ncbi:UNVERIFIED_CONTAM: hypothetical protein K2H54_053857 [Gekko kuhli]